MIRPQIPLANEILGEGHKAATALRPTIEAHLAAGRYGDVFAGWKAQCTLVLARLAHEAACARVPLAEGKTLLELLASEFDTVISAKAEHAIGHVLLRRRTIDGQPFGAGLIRPGTRFRRLAYPNALPAAKEAYYESVEPVFVGSEDGVAPSTGIGKTQHVKVRIRALQAGKGANIPRTIGSIVSYKDPSPVVLADSVFDPGFSAIYAEAAGGSDGFSDARLRAIAQALSTGKFGPTTQAIMAGLLLTEGVSRAAVWEDLRGGSVFAWIADESWACSDELRALALQNLKDKWLGFGCKAFVGLTSNVPISVAAEICLRDKRFSADTLILSQKVQESLIQYFNRAVGWHAWSYSGIRGAIAKADRRILSVRSISVSSLSGASLSEPDPAPPENTFTPITHYDVDQTNVKLTFVSS